MFNKGGAEKVGSLTQWVIGGGLLAVVTALGVLIERVLNYRQKLKTEAAEARAREADAKAKEANVEVERLKAQLAARGVEGEQDIKTRSGLDDRLFGLIDKLTEQFDKSTAQLKYTTEQLNLSEKEKVIYLHHHEECLKQHEECLKQHDESRVTISKLQDENKGQGERISRLEGQIKAFEAAGCVPGKPPEPQHVVMDFQVTHLDQPDKQK